VVTAAAIPDLTFTAEGQAVVRKTRVVKTAAAAVVAGFPIAVGIVLLLDAMQKRRANRAAAAAAAPPAEIDRDEEDEDLDLEAQEDLAPARAGVATALADTADDVEDDLFDEDEAEEPVVLRATAARAELADDLADDEDLDDDFDDLDDDIEATVASRRRLYDADIDDDLTVDGGHNGHGREWAKVPASGEDFDGDDEGAGADR
jgi:hypothetical protein